MKRMFVLFFIIFSVNTYAVGLQQLRPSGSKLIEATGIPIYAKATFSNGAQQSGFRFVTRLAPDKVRAWYRNNCPSGDYMTSMAAGYFTTENPQTCYSGTGSVLASMSSCQNGFLLVKT